MNRLSGGLCLGLILALQLMFAAPANAGPIPGTDLGLVTSDQTIAFSGITTGDSSNPTDLTYIFSLSHGAQFDGSIGGNDGAITFLDATVFDTSHINLLADDLEFGSGGPTSSGFSLSLSPGSYEVSFLTGGVDGQPFAYSGSLKFAFATTPIPASLVLFGTALLAMLGLAGYQRQMRAA